MKTMFNSNTMGGFIGLGLMIVGAASGMAQNPVTFQIDMTSQPAATDVYILGSFNNWGNPSTPFDPNFPTNGLLLANDGSGIFTNTVNIPDSVGTVEYCKVFYNPGGNWEGDPNRGFVIAGGPQVLPLSAWNEKYPAPTNDVTFQVDMTAQIILGNFSPDQTMRVAGSMYTPDWGDGIDLTNNPALSGNASNVYSAVIPVGGFPGAGFDYKFRANGGWENPTSTGGNNRHFELAGGDQVLPLVFYNDASPCDLLSETNWVTFTVDMTGAVTYDPVNGSVAFDGSQPVYINGDFYPDWWGGKDWADPFFDRTPYTLTNVSGTSNYSAIIAVPRGRTVAITYKYGIGNTPLIDNEAGFQTNHVRYVRTQPYYTMPVDKFGSPEGLVEPSFGNLKAAASGGGNVSVTWLGRQCVTLQTSTNLVDWTDHPETDSMNSTNWPVGGDSLYFRLVKP